MGYVFLQLSKKDLGEYKATLKDDRGQDVSVLEIAGKGKTKPSLLPATRDPFCQRDATCCEGTSVRVLMAVTQQEKDLCFISILTCFSVLEECVMLLRLH